MDDNLKAVLSENIGKLMVANAELVAANITLTSAYKAAAEENGALKAELEMMKQTWTKPVDG